MLDKENKYNVDEQFTQDAWLQMEQMLDKEMPVVEKKKRRGAFWIWFAGLGILILSFGIWSINTNDVNDPIIAETMTLETQIDTEKDKVEETKLLEKSIPHPSANTSTLNPKSPQKEISNPSSSITKNNTTTSNHSNQLAPQTGRPHDPVNELPQNSSVLNNRIFPPVPPSQEQGAKASILNDFPIKFEGEAIDKNPAKKEREPIVNIVKPLNINALSMLSLNTLAMKKSTPSLRLAIKEESSTWRKSNVNWGLEIGTQTANLQNINGLFAGVLVDFSLNPRWFISSGIRYNYNRYETDPLSLGQKENDSFSAPGVRFGSDTTSFNNGPTPTSNEAYQAINNLLKTQASFHALSVPLTLNYRLNSKWSVNGGGHISYLLGAGPVFQSSTSSVALLDAEALDNSFGTAVQESITRRWDFAIRTGVRYEINNRIGTGLNYQSVLKRNQGTNNRETLQNSVLQLSLNFKF